MSGNKLTRRKVLQSGAALAATAFAAPRVSAQGARQPTKVLDFLTNADVLFIQAFFPADKAKLLLVLEDVERQRNRSSDPEIGIRAQLTGLVDLLEPLLRRPDPRQIQEQHELPNIAGARG